MLLWCISFMMTLTCFKKIPEKNFQGAPRCSLVTVKATEAEQIYISEEVVTGVNPDPGLFGGKWGTGKWAGALNFQFLYPSLQKECMYSEWVLEKVGLKNEGRLEIWLLIWEKWKWTHFQMCIFKPTFALK